MSDRKQSLALVVISTGVNYRRYITPLVESARKYFLPHDLILFTDDTKVYGVFSQFPVEPRGFPLETLYRYHTILAYEDIFHRYDHIFYVDVDTVMVNFVGEEIISDGITATLHAGFSEGNGTWETRHESTACVEPGKRKHYFCGGFNGGSGEAYLRMARVIAASIDVDDSNGIKAIWNDESHSNRYLSDNPPARVLSSAYCYPEPFGLTQFDPAKILPGIEALRSIGRSEQEIWSGQRCEPKILCLEKRWHQEEKQCLSA